MTYLLDCKHNRTHFIGSSRWVGTAGNGHYHISMCKDCGRIRVNGAENGQGYEVAFNLSTVEHIESALKYISWINETAVAIAPEVLGHAV